MNSRTIIRRGVLAAVAAALLSAAPAHAALSAASIECRATIAKNYGKLLKSANKVVAGCHKSRNSGKILAAVDCNVMAQADADKGKYLKASTKAAAAVTDACGGEPTASLTAANVGGEPGETELYVSCPYACTGVSLDGIVNTTAELGACLGCTAAGIAGDVGATTLGLPVPADLNKEEQKCHGAIAKGYGKYLSTGHKGDTSCQGDADEAGTYSLTSCFNTPAADPKGKTAKALTKAGEGLDKSCAGMVNIADLDTCAPDTLANVKICNAAAWADAEDDAFTTTYELPALGCPSTTRTTIRGGCSTNGSVVGGCSSGFETGTVLSVGWKGLAHGVDITDNYTVAADIVCPGTAIGSCTTVGDTICAGGNDNGEPCTIDADCTGGGDCQGNCVSTGISVDNPQYQAFTRCLDAPWTPCSTPFANDAACPSMGACRYFLGPPLAVSAGGTPTCTLNVVNTDIIGGTGNPDTGEANFSIDLRSVVHLGVSQSRPCPYCRNDATPQDGVKEGTCFDGPRDGELCDVQGFDMTFALTQACVGGSEPGTSCQQDSDCAGGGTCQRVTTGTGQTAGNSLDCPPTSGANISGSGLAIDLPLTTGVSTKDAVDPCESPNAGLDCFCGVCSGDGTVSCNSDTECIDQALGTCGIGGGVARKPNNCSDLTCTPTSSDRGECSTAPDIDQYCSGVLFTNGKGVISCGVDADCDSYISVSPNPDDWVCPGNVCGTCTESNFRSCFNDPMSVTGTPDPANPILVGTFCLPPSSNGSVNNATGSPGPGTVQTDTIVQLRY